MLQTPIVEMQVAAQEHSVALEAVARLFQALHQHGVRYCHWKSNLRLEHGLSGRTDLDLLVDRRHSQVFRQILYEHNVKPVLAAPGKRYPGIEDYLGFDPASGRLFHLHVHYQLVLGEQFVKNYRLPLEAHFLDSARPRHGVNIPTPELEIIVLSMRALLKYRNRDVIKDILSIRSSGLPDHILTEIKFLLEQTSMERIAQTLTEVADVVPADTVLKFLETVVDAPRAGFTFYRLRKSVRQALHTYQRHNRLRATFTYFQELWRRRNSFLRFSRARKMTLPGGGITLALIGADGAGKSTMCQMLAGWLSWKMDVHTYYLGSKEPSQLSERLYILFRMARRSQRAISRALGEENVLSRCIAGLRDSLLYTHHLSIGRDRYRRYLNGRDKAMAGSIVIYDRHPLESISTQMEYRLLDGPQIPLLANGQEEGIARICGRAEQDLYRKMRPPDHLFVLDVSPDVSLQRKPDHQRAAIEAKSQALAELMALDGQLPGQLNLIRIDANLSFEAVLSQLKMHIWKML